MSKIRWTIAGLAPDEKAIWNSARDMSQSPGFGSGSGAVRLSGPAKSVAERHRETNSRNRVCRSARSTLVSLHVSSRLYRLCGVSSSLLITVDSAAVSRTASTAKDALFSRWG
eukprot:scaffold1734_cov113-Isochrysis_galbana.AAC.19